ncbi:MAG: hypothetical protein GYB67_18595, partial [Chloroflexi bacterium]|nr:hypothetical protein [Chloroflexota bacterium]
MSTAAQASASVGARRSTTLLAVTLVILAGAALRITGLGAMSTLVHHDEAYYGVDALSLLASPRLTPFFPDNFGRESLWMYTLTPALAIFGGGAFALRLTAIFTGILTLAALYPLGRALFGPRAAIWAVAALAVLFWHVLHSHHAFRAILYPLVGALAFAVLWRAHRANRWPLWIAGGALLGLLLYTYLAARLWLILAGLLLIGWFITTPAQRRQIATAALIWGLISLPLVITLLDNPQTRIAQVAITSVDELIANMRAWVPVWVTHGVDEVVHNLPGRPILDAPLAILAAAGLIGGWWVVRRRIQALWIGLLLIASLAAAILTTAPLTMLRSVGAVIPLAL